MDKVNIRIVAPATARTVDFSRVTWLRAYDPEGHDGYGTIELTTDRAKAMTLQSAGDAFTLYRQVPKCRQLRPDGKPNRPLTAFTVEIVRVGVEPT